MDPVPSQLTLMLQTLIGHHLLCLNTTKAHDKKHMVYMGPFVNHNRTVVGCSVVLENLAVNGILNCESL